MPPECIRVDVQARVASLSYRPLGQSEERCVPGNHGDFPRDDNLPVISDPEQPFVEGPMVGLTKSKAVSNVICAKH